MESADETSQPSDQAMPPVDDSNYVVGIGASAGGLESLEQFFRNVPIDSGLAFVVVQHLSPDFKSMMDELLARHTKLRIHRVENGMQVERDSIYLIPPKKEMIISGGRLLLTDKDPDRDLSLPIDHFFRSLAQDVGRCSVAIVLSGTGSDGSRGILDVHEAGGIVLSQNEESAKFDGMPKSARDTGIVDYVLPPEEMPAALISHLERWGAANSCGTAPAGEEGDLKGYDAIFKLLRDEYGIDFSYYKPNTVSRRIERRLSMNQSTDLDDYVAQLRIDPAELNALYKDLLIGVTRFFRDKDAFDRMERSILPEIIKRSKSGEELRVWVAGCATGEEPYSLAILIHEGLQSLGRPVNVKIFATDVHQTSLEFASSGAYAEEALADVTPARLSRYFVKRGNRYQIANELRQMVVFARHNVIKDAPFTKLDLITCRNLLIYFQPPAQKKALSLFHFGLKTGGVLVLGPSESPGELSGEFEALDEHWKIYRKRRDVRLPPDMRSPLSIGLGPVRPTTSPSTTFGYDASLMATYDQLLAEFMPTGLLLNDRRELVHTFGDAGRLLRHRPGRPTTDVIDMLEGDLKMALAGAIQRASKEQTPVVYHGIRVGTGEGEEQIKLTVKPVFNRHGNLTHLYVGLESLGAVEARPRTSAELDVDEASREHLNSLETELRYTRENLQATIEELETSNEELQASNEELVASNEELQSTNEELHSVNEELYTVNAEYQKKIVELTELTDDMDNLLRSTEVGTIFLDRNLSIRKFTPEIGRAFNLLPQDVGRRINGFSHTIRYPRLMEDVQRVLDAGEPIEKEVQDRDGKWFFARLLPYRSHSKLEGVVLTLIDVTALKRSEMRLREMSAIVESSEDAIVGMSLDGRIITWNRGAAAVYGYDSDEVLGSHVAMLAKGGAGEPNLEKLREMLDATAGEKLREHHVEMTTARKDGRLITVLCSFSPIRDGEDGVIGLSMIARDISARKEAEQDRERYAEELEAINSQLREEVGRRQAAEAEARDGVEKRDHFLAMLSHELRNPLAAVLNSASILQWEHLDKETVDEARGAIARQSMQMARLMDDLLDVSRITRGRIVIRRKPVDLVESSRDAIEAVKPALEGKNLQLHVELPPSPLPVKGDAARLQQIQVNLLTNAIKYTPPGGEVWLRASQEEDQAVIRVRDTGLGIPPGMRDRIFDLFFQVDDTPGKTETGMGVGLTLVRTLVQLHGGEILVESKGINRGSEFIVRLPLVNEQPVQNGEADPEPTLHGLRVVLVEDRADIRIVTSKLLQAFGCEVTATENGLDAVAAVANVVPDVALVDIGLPDISGYEVAERIRALPKGNDVKLLALTGFGQPDDREKALAAGFNEHLVKPLDYQSLLSAIDSASRNGQG